MGKRQRALLHEHIVALCAIIVAIMARQLSVLALALSQLNAEREKERKGEREGDGCFKFWSCATQQREEATHFS